MSTYPMTLRLQDPSHTNEKGELFLGDLDEPIVGVWQTNTDQCNHSESACGLCITDWAHEYFGTAHLPEGDMDINALAETLVASYGSGGLRSLIEQIETEEDDENL